MSNLPSPFKSSKGEAEYMAAYEATMQLWTVPSEDRYIPSRFGSTHLVGGRHWEVSLPPRGECTLLVVERE